MMNTVWSLLYIEAYKQTKHKEEIGGFRGEEWGERSEWIAFVLFLV